MSGIHSKKIGHFEVIRELGRGGMGVVYLGHDTRLGRDVAIKALPAHMSNDPARLERFEREARMLAQLSHPNVAGIHGVEMLDGQRHLVLEYVDGVTVAERLDRGALPVDEALDLASQIASGMEAAHNAGVIHRDLKPANIIITHEGIAKILDFGLARAEESSESSASDDSPTLTSPAAHSPTIPGVILGTAAYMSPEQARGRRVDKRTDIWSFGVVLYEMLTGASPFVGETVSDSIGAVLHKQINLDRLPKSVPPGVRRVIACCVERDKDLRYRDIGDVRMELLRARDEPETTPAHAAKRPMPLAVTALLLIVVAASTWMAAQAMREPGARSVRKFDVMTGSKENPLDIDCPAISPDGKRLAYIKDELIYIREFSSFESRELSGADGAISLFWSPDSQWIAYLTSDAVYKVALLGGGAVKVASVPGQAAPRGRGGWTADGRLVFTDSRSILSVPARGGIPTVLIELDQERLVDFHECSVIPGTNTVLFTEHRSDLSFAVVALDGGTRVEITTNDEQPLLQPIHSPTGHVMYVTGYTRQEVWAVGFDPDTMAVTSEPFLVLSEAADVSVSNDGTLAVYRGLVGDIPRQLAWVGPDGVEPIGDPLDFALFPMLSPDESKLALGSGELQKMDLWIYDLNRNSKSRITFLEATFVTPAAWSPDGREIAVGIFDPKSEPRLTTRFYNADGSGETREKIDGVVSSFDAEWRFGVLVDGATNRDSAVSYFDLDDPSDTTELLKLDISPNGAILNPAGTLMAYVLRESGEPQVYCTQFPDIQGRWQVSINGGDAPRWSPDGKVLYFINYVEEKIYAVDVTTEPAIQFGMPRVFVDGKALDVDIRGGWWVASDGERVVTLLSEDSDDQVGPDTLSVIENWYEEYRSR